MRFNYLAVSALVFCSFEPSSVLAQSTPRRRSTITYDSNSSTSGDSPIHDNNESNRNLNTDQVFQFSSSAHVCLLSYDIIQCVGYNYYGQLGQSSSDTFGTPVLLNFPSSITVKPIKVVTGYDHTCTLFNDGHVWCNGSNGFGQLGNGGNVNSATPVQVKKNGAVLTNVMDIEAGAYHNCAIQNTGAVYCWGFNTDGQLGLNSLADGVDQARSVVLVVLSMSATCAITASDATQVICVGYGYSSSDNASTTIDLGHAVTALTAGSTHFCALLDTTKAKCWGTNHKGQLGIGSAEFTSAYMNTPVFVLQDSTGTELSGITNINAAYSSTCLVANGKPMCFGNNNYYQLGVANGGAIVLYPTLVTPFNSITGKILVSMHVGEYTGHAVFHDDSVYSVGTNNGGTFGDGSTISSRNVIGDASGAIAKQISFVVGSSSPSLIPSNSPSSSPSVLPSLSPSSNPSQDPNLLGDENSHITFNDIDFGSTNSVKGIKITYANGEINSSGSVEVKLGDASGTTLAQFSPPGTGTWVLSNIMLIPFDNTIQLSGINSLTFTTSETTATIHLISYELIDLSERYTPFTTIHAPAVSTCSGVSTSDEVIGYFDNGDYFTYSPIDFGSGANSIQITYAKGTSTGTFEIRKGNHETGEIIGTYSPASTGSWETFATVEIPIKTSYGIDQLTFRGTYSDGVMNLKSFQLSPDTAGYICLDPTVRTHTASVQAAASAQTGANLVSIRCSAQQNAVASMSITTGPWIGGTDVENEGTWVLPDGSAMTYFNWNAGEPNNAGDEDCIVIGSDGLWFDGPCNSGTVTGPAIFESTFAIAGLTCIEYVECQDSVKIVENGIQTADTLFRNNNLVNQSDTAGTYLSVPGNSISPNNEDNWNVYNLPIGANDDFVMLAKLKVDGTGSAASFFINDLHNFGFDGSSNQIFTHSNSAFYTGFVELNKGTHHDNLFYFKVERKLGIIKFYINDEEVASTANYNVAISRFYWRPWRANLKIYEWTVTSPSNIQTVSPTSSPTSSPTKAPTPAPTASPTSSPPINVALSTNGAIATQSSTYNIVPRGASLAIDGNTNGIFAEGSVTHTNVETAPWWKVKLPREYSISRIVVYSRSDDCCIIRLNNFVLTVMYNNAVVFTYNDNASPVLVITTIPIEPNVIGDEVKIQTFNSVALNLAEVVVEASPSETQYSLAFNVNPSDGNNVGSYSPMWNVNSNVGSLSQALSHDYKSVSAWSQQFQCLAVARHNGAGIADGIKVWKLSTQNTLTNHFQSSDRAVMTSGGPVQVISESGVNYSTDPMLASSGVNNNLAFNWRYSNNYVRVVLTDVGHWSGTLSGENVNDDSCHGIGNDFEYPATQNWVHDASIIQGACFGNSCSCLGTDHGGEFTLVEPKLGNYAFLVSETDAGGNCPIASWNILQTQTISPSSTFFDGVQLTGYTAGQCIGYDGYKDLFMYACTDGVAQKFTLTINGLIVWGGLDNMCLLADGLMWPKLRTCDGSNQNQLWTYENGQFKTAGGTKCLGIFDNSNRLKVGDCATVSSTWYD